jgi:hypothetical protein
MLIITCTTLPAHHVCNSAIRAAAWPQWHPNSSNKVSAPYVLFVLCWGCCRYFADLAAQASSLHAVAPPSRKQLRQAYAQLQETASAPLADVSIACQAAGIGDDTLQRVVAAGRIDASKAVNVLEVLLLLLTMSCETFAGTVQGIFEVFGSSNDSSSNVLPVLDFLALLGYLAAYDSDVSAALQQQVAEALSGQLDTDYKGLKAIPALADKLA